MVISSRVICTSAFLLAAIAGPALAEEPVAAVATTTPAYVKLDMSRLSSPFALSEEQAAAMRAGIARTAVDHQFADKLTGSLGFLCGLHGETYQGAAAMRGSDPDGRFLGAKLSLAFR